MTHGALPKLKIYTSKRYALPGRSYIPLLYPFWGAIEEPPENPDRGRFDAWTAAGTSVFTLSSLEEADAVVLPCEWPEGGGYSEAHALGEEARKSGKPLVVFFNSDSIEPIPLLGATVFRTSLYKSSQREREFALPAWSRDFLTAYLGGHVDVRRKSDVPSVGYVGYVHSSFGSAWRRVGRAVRGREWKIDGAGLRRRAIKALSTTAGIKTSVISRRECLTGKASARARGEFVRNIADVDYTLVARGGGNFSYRLYEVLSCGRIPLFLNTDCVLPFDHLIDWKSQMLWVEAAEVDRIGEIVQRIHSSLSDAAFVQLQLNARRLYETWLSPYGFYSNIWRCIATPDGTPRFLPDVYRPPDRCGHESDVAPQ